MSARRTTATALLLMVAMVSCWQTPSAWGFAYWSQDTDPTGFTHILNNPNDYPSWDLTNITYKFDTGFTTDSRIRDQVRLAFDQWDVADATVDGASLLVQPCQRLARFRRHTIRRHSRDRPRPRHSPPGPGGSGQPQLAAQRRDLRPASRQWGRTDAELDQ